MTDALPAALVLAAGLGTRFRPLSAVRAKPAAPVAGTPLVVRILQGLRGQGLREAVVNLHHRPDTIARVLGDGRALGLRVRYSWEQPVLGSAGGPRHALPLIDTDPFLVVNGDTLSGVDARGLLAEHARTGALVTMAVVENPDPAAYGGVRVGEDGVVQGFTRRGDPAPAYHFVGVQAVAKAAFATLADGVPAESVTGVYRELIASRPGSVRAWLTRAPFLDIGTVAGYHATCLAVAASSAGAALSGARVEIAPGARVTRSVLWDDVRIGEGCVVDECVLADGVAVPAGACLRGCAVVPAGACGPGPGDHVVAGLLVSPFLPQGAAA